MIEFTDKFVSLISETERQRFVNFCATQKRQVGFLPRHQNALVEIDQLKNLLTRSNKIELVPQFIFNSFENGGFENQEVQEKVNQVVDLLRPWRKGPYQLGNRLIDSEWNSELKWQRIKSSLGSLKAKKVADVGGNNGYFSFKLFSDLLESEQPDYALILDPTINYYLQFRFLEMFGFSNLKNRLSFELIGFQEMRFFTQSFNLVLALGILYHHSNPIEILKLIHQSLVPQGEVIIDCQGIELEQQESEEPIDLPLSLFPRSTYTDKKGFWFLPNLEGLKNWLYRTGFKDVELIYRESLMPTEQRTSLDAPFPSLEEGFDGNKTTEGYPLPIRYYLKAKKK